MVWTLRSLEVTKFDLIYFGFTLPSARGDSRVFFSRARRWRRRSRDAAGTRSSDWMTAELLRPRPTYVHLSSTHTHTHTRARARARAHTHAHTHTRTHIVTTPSPHRPHTVPTRSPHSGLDSAVYIMSSVKKQCARGRGKISVGSVEPVTAADGTF